MLTKWFCGVAGSFFFVIILCFGEVSFEVWPGFVSVRFVVKIFNCVYKYAIFCDDDNSDADELDVCFRIYA